MMINKTLLKISFAFVAILLSINAFSQITKEIELKDFHKLTLEGASSYILIQSDHNKLEVEVQKEDVMDYIKINNERGELKINTTAKNKNVSRVCSKLVFKVYYVNVSVISFGGAGSLRSQNQMNTNVLRANMNGAGSLHLNIKCQGFTGSVSGTGSLDVQGVCKKSNLKLSGVGSIKATKLISEDTKVVVSGVGHAKVYASHRLIAEVNGVGSIYYLGNPTEKHFEKNGIGTIKPLK